ncbi:hypothetical protein BDQ17DRAFT_1328618 [Cyathus striatus]|nr:hypothetical protein BDQ17DRAFT_1328618 [Cyathus striatus]
MARKKPSTNKAASNSEASTLKPQGQKAKKDPEETDDVAKDDKIDWNANDHRETWLLISKMTTDMKIKNGLFPPPGGHLSTTKGGGKKKTDWHWKLAIAMFEKHDVFGESFKLVLDAQRQERIMAKGGIPAATKHIADMGQTGAGLKSADEIAEGTPLHTKWDQIKQMTPWFYEMKNLISEHPNCTPIGLGHSGTQLDLSLLAEGASSEAEGVDGWQNSDIDHDEEPATVPTPSSEFGTGMSDSEEDLPVELFAEVDREDSYPAKQKLEPDSKEDLSSPLPRPRTTARPNSSKPAVATPARNTKRSKIGGDIFAVAELEASTREKKLTMKLELEKARIVAEARERVELAKVNQEVILEREKRKTERNCQCHERSLHVSTIFKCFWGLQ